MPCAPQAREKRRGKCAAEVYTAQPIIYSYTDTARAAHDTAHRQQRYQAAYTDTKPESARQPAREAAYTAAHRSRNTKRRYLYSQYPCRTASRRHATPTPGFGGGVRMKLCQRVEVILFRPFSQPSSKNFGLNEVSLLPVFSSFDFQASHRILERQHHVYHQFSLFICTVRENVTNPFIKLRRSLVQLYTQQFVSRAI